LLKRAQLEEIAEGFEKINGFPNNMQYICDHRMRILSYSIMSGLHNDKLLWLHSKVGRNANRIVPTGYHFIGDSGYMRSCMIEAIPAINSSALKADSVWYVIFLLGKFPRNAE
jgi:hypothetical protein